MWEIYIMFYKTLEMQSQTTSNHSPLPQEICAPVVGSHGTNGYYLFSKFNRFGVCHLCELKVHMQVKPRKPFTVSKQFVRFSSSV